MNYINPSYLNLGDKVIAPFDSKGTGIRCIVITAAGYHVQVLNKNHDFCKWFHLDELKIPG